MIRPVDTDALGVERVTGQVDLTIAHPARVYDYLLGGQDNWPADREVAERVASLVPGTRDEVRANREFLGRAVRYAAEQGVTRFLDIGTGIPTVGPTHEIAQSVHPDARVVYVDNDPIVLTHARAMLVNDDLTCVVQADAREPGTILDHPQTRRLLDLGEPVALMFVALLHFITDRDLDGLVERYTRALAPGSHLIISHALQSPVADAARPAYKTSAQVTPRSRERIAGLFGDWDLVEPGVVPVGEWHPDRTDGPRSVHMYGGVAVKR